MEILFDNLVNEWKLIKQKFMKYYKMFILIYIVACLLYQFFINNLLINGTDTMANGTFYLNRHWDIGLGRFFVAILKSVFAGVNAEPLNSLIALFFICLSLVFIFIIFDINNKYSVFLSLSILTSPVVYYILSHRYSSIAASIQLFFSVIAFYIFVYFNDKIISTLLTIISLIISLLLGQYSLSIFILLFLFYIIFLVVNKSEPFKMDFYLKAILRFLFTLIISLIIYRLIWLLSVTILHIPLSSYRDNSNINILNIIEAFPFALLDTYKIFFNYFNGEMIKFNIFSFYNLYFVLFAISLISLFYTIYCKYKKILIAIIFTIIFAILVPPILSLPIFFTPSFHSLLAHSLVPFPFFIMMLFLFLNKLKTNHAHKRVMHIFLIFKGILVMICILLFAQFLQMSVDFDTMYRTRLSTTNINNLILSKLENMELLNSDGNYYIYGNYTKSPLFYLETYDEKGVVDKTNYQFLVGNTSNYGEWSYEQKRGFFRNYMGLDIKTNVFENFTDFFNSDEFKEAKPFPSDESIFTMPNNCVIIKISN